LIKRLLHIILLILPLSAMAQDGAGDDKKSTTWKSEKDFLDYRKTEGYRGPDDWYGSYPAEMDSEEEYTGNGYNPGSGSGAGSSRGVQYSPQQIQRDRQERYQGFDRGGGKGTLDYDPEVAPPKPLELPDIDAPDIPAPDIDLDLDAPNVSGWGIWKILLFILLAVAIVLIFYFIFKNAKPPNKKVLVDVENDWNPEVISKTELELRLEAAMEKGDYRECVRIYFTFILKELIRKSWVHWKRDKTNHHYLQEMRKRPNQHVFVECVRIYDLVWYGEYEIDKEVFEMLLPTLENYYQSLDPVNE
jgi:hypothetical protein